MIFGWFRRRFARARVRRQLDSIERDNAAGRNVNEYRAPVEAYVKSDRVENVVVSGNNKSIRDRVCCAAAFRAHSLGYPVIVLHSGNEQLERMLTDAFTADRRALRIINEGNKIYDPFLDLNKDQISQLVLSSADDSCRIQHNGGIYIKGLVDYLTARSQVPSARSFIRCPHDEMWNRIRDHVNDGSMSSDVANVINDEITRGQSERGNVKLYFDVLEKQAQCILADRDAITSGRAVSIRRAVAGGQVVAIDVVPSSGNLLLNILTQEMKDEMSAGRPFVFILDGVPTESSKALGDLLRTFSSRCRFVYSSRDAYAESSGSENTFETIVGRANTVFVTQHDSARTGNRFSEYFGRYRFNEVNNSISTGDTYQTYGTILPGYSTNNVYSVSHVDRPRVEEREITGLPSDRVFIKQEGRTEIILLRVTSGIASLTYPEPRRRSAASAGRRGHVNWLIFAILLVLSPPLAFVYGFFTSGRRGKIVFGSLFLACVAAALIYYKINGAF